MSIVKSPLFGDFVLLVFKTIGAYALIAYMLYKVFEHSSDGISGAEVFTKSAGESTVMGMVITGSFMVIQRNQELIKDRWHQLQMGTMTEHLQNSTPKPLDTPLDLTGSEIDQ